MWKFLAPPAYKSEQVGPEADRRYKSLRLQVFIGAFVGYAAFYIVRKNFSMAIPIPSTVAPEDWTIWIRKS